MAKVKLTLQKHYQELEEQVKGQFEFDFSEDYEAVRGQTLLSAVEKHYQELQKRYDKEEADLVHCQEELAKAQEKAPDLAKSYQEAKATLYQAKERLKDLKEAHPELESVESIKNEFPLRSRSWTSTIGKSRKMVKLQPTSCRHSRHQGAAWELDQV